MEISYEGAPSNDPLFEYIPNSRSAKVRCVVCGARGFDGCRWQDNCKKGHPYQCSTCGARKSTGQGLANHIRLKHGISEKIS